uniref:Uncharacterized protein n=1 Tax=viral metagenome TaxID=1070528 RepID=A0A6C0JLE1_9ZZZZ
MSVTQEMIDLLRASVIPEGVTWGDFFSDDFSTVSTIEYEESICSSGEWETVGLPKQEMRQPRWCKHGNACIWQNCPFRHERCEHFDKWVASRGKTRGCRCQVTDPRSCKSPEEGGCKYDHRDLRHLEVYHKSLPCNTEAELWDNFYERGLEARADNAYDVTGMTRTNRALLVRSLLASNVEFIDNDTWLNIHID